MKLELHAAPSWAGAAPTITIGKRFPPHHDAAARRLVCETEARVLYDCLKEALPPETKDVLLGLFCGGF